MKLEFINGLSSLSRCGVYDAVIAALSKKGFGEKTSVPEVKLYLDGKQITATVERTQRERGLPLIDGVMGW